MEGVAGTAGGVDARGEAGVAARHVGVVRRRVIAEGVSGAAAGGDVGGGGGGERERHDGLVNGAVRVVRARLVGDTRGQLYGDGGGGGHEEEGGEGQSEHLESAA